VRVIDCVETTDILVSIGAFTQATGSRASANASSIRAAYLERFVSSIADRLDEWIRRLRVDRSHFATKISRGLANCAVGLEQWLDLASIR